MTEPVPLREVLESIAGTVGRLADKIIADAPLDQLRWVLWMVNERTLGTEPTVGIREFLLETSKFDVWQKAILSPDFPIITYYQLALQHKQLVIAEVQRREGDIAARFDMPAPVANRNPWHPSPRIKVGTRVRVVDGPGTEGAVPIGQEFVVTCCLSASFDVGNFYALGGRNAINADPGVWTKYLEVIE